ncbi:hypothetical protein D918_01154 [Trichuris suis]|nr:hypothetical protein D918_01154 [Trichuris suis]
MYAGVVVYLLIFQHYGSFLMQPTDPVVEGENDFILGFGNEVLVTILVALLVAPFVSWLAQYTRVGNLMWMFRLRIVVCVIVAIVYALSPFDIIPEALFGLLGMLDDIFVVVLLLVYLSIAYRRFISFHLHR